MLKPIKTFNLHHGRAHINWDGTIWIQQGRPFGSMANPGEAMLSQEDLKAIQVAMVELRATGWKPVKPGTVVAR